jgi:carbamoyl-phosphate synthase/aspartate carbamoyltransferase
VEWPFLDSGVNAASKSAGSSSPHNIADYLTQKKICLFINLPLRQHRTTPAITKGYITRRMAIEYSVPLITDVKCAKLLIKVHKHV